MPTQSNYRSLIYSGEPDITELTRTYEGNLSNLDYYFQQTRTAYDNRRSYWPGKTKDNKKSGADAFPWTGASDLDVKVIEERILKYVSKCQNALRRSWVKAYPVGVEDAARAKTVSIYLKWLQNTGIPRFSITSGRNLNYWFEKGLMITHGGYVKAENRVETSISIRDIEEGNPEMADLITMGDADDILADLLAAEFEISESRAKKAIRQLREQGETQIPHSTRLVDRVELTACAPDHDVMFPAWTIDPQKAPWVFWRTLMSPGEVLSRVQTEGWDRDWADHVIEHHRGVSSMYLGNSQTSSQISPLSRFHATDNDLVEVVHCYQRLVDEEDGAEGIYRTVFSPQPQNPEDQGASAGMAKHELLSGFTQYPFVVTRLMDDQERLYDLQTFPDLMRSAQEAVKVERDSRIDANSLRNNPPLMHDSGKPPTGTWGPGGRIGRRRNNEFTWAPVPPPNPQSMADEGILLQHIDGMLGLDSNDPHGASVEEYFVGRSLDHWKEVMNMAYDLDQQFGPDERFVRVTGHPDMEKMTKVPGERVDVNITFNTLMNDPDNMEKVFTMMSTLFQFDDSGRLGKEEFLEWAASAIDPTLAAHVIKPAEEGKRDYTRKVAEDLTMIRSGIEVNAQPNGAPMAMQLVQQWAAQPDVMQELQQNELFQQRLQKYVMQYAFALQQQQNAVTGRLGTEPAQFDVTETEVVGGGMPQNGMRQ